MGITVGGKMIAKYWKAVVAGLSLLSAFLTQMLADPSISGVIPQNVANWITAGVAILGTVLTFMIRNQQTVDSIDTAIGQGDVSVPEVKSLMVKHDVGNKEAPPRSTGAHEAQ
jgi:hypothetical protein